MNGSASFSEPKQQTAMAPGIGWVIFHQLACSHYGLNFRGTDHAIQT